MSIDIERGAVTSVKNILRRSKIIVPYVDENDKSPIWDGNLFIYKQLQKSENNYKNENLLGKIPIQVKGKSVSNVNDKTTKYSFSVNDLRSYKQDGGAIIFVVELINNYKKNKFDERVFKKILLPFDLKKKLDNIKKGQKSLTLKLNHFNPNSIENFELECKNFISDRERQYSTTEVEVSSEEINKKSIKVIASKEKFTDYIFNHELYLYGKNENWPTSVPIEKVKLSTIRGKANKSVSVNDTKYFNSYIIEQNQDSIKLIFEDDLYFVIKDKNLKFNYKYHDNFYKRYNCLKFLNDMLNNNGFKIDEKGIKITGNINKDGKVQDLIKEYEGLKPLATLLDYFNINYRKLDLSTISKKGQRNLKILVDKIVYNKDISANFNDLPGLYQFKIGNINILTFIIEKNKRIVIKKIDEIAEEIIIRKEDKKAKDVSPYILLSFKDILNSDNIKPLAIKESIFNSKYDNIYSKKIVYLILDMIKVYDETNNSNYLEEALDIIRWLKTKESNNPIHIINEYQIYKRQRGLYFNEKEKLKELIKTRTDFDEYYKLICCAYILLDDFNNFKKYYDKLDRTKKDEFKKYPIYSLYKPS